MSWTDVFPVMTPRMVDIFEAEVSANERGRYEGWLGTSAKFKGESESTLVSSEQW